MNILSARRYRRQFRSALIAGLLLPVAGCAVTLDSLTIVARQKSRPAGGGDGVRNRHSGIEILGDEELIIPVESDPRIDTLYYDYLVRFPGEQFTGGNLQREAGDRISLAVTRTGDHAMLDYLLLDRNLWQADDRDLDEKIREADASLHHFGIRYDSLGRAEGLEVRTARLKTLETLTTAARARFLTLLPGVDEHATRLHFPELAPSLFQYQRQRESLDHLRRLHADLLETSRTAQRAIADGSTTSRSLVRRHEQELAAFDDALSAAPEAFRTSAPQDRAGFLANAEKITSVTLGVIQHGLLKIADDNYADLRSGIPGLTTAVTALSEWVRLRDERDRLLREADQLKSLPELITAEENRRTLLTARKQALRLAHPAAFDAGSTASLRYLNPDTLLVRVFARDLRGVIGESFEIRAGYRGLENEQARLRVRVFQGIVKTRAYLLPRQQTAQLFGRAFAANFYTVRIQIANDSRFPVVIYGDSVEPSVTFSFTRRVQASGLRLYLEEMGGGWDFHPNEQILHRLARIKGDNPQLNARLDRLRMLEDRLMGAMDDEYIAQQQYRFVDQPLTAFDPLPRPLHNRLDFNDYFPAAGEDGLAGARKPLQGSPESMILRARLDNLLASQAGLNQIRQAPRNSVPDVWSSNMQPAGRSLSIDSPTFSKIIRTQTRLTTDSALINDIYNSSHEKAEEIRILVKALADEKPAGAAPEMNSPLWQVQNKRIARMEIEKEVAQARREYERALDEQLLYNSFDFSENIPFPFLNARIPVIHEIEGSYQMWTANDILRVFQGIEAQRPLTLFRRILLFGSTLIGGTASLSDDVDTLRNAGIATGLVIPGTLELLKSDVQTHLTNLNDLSFRPVEEIKSGVSITRLGFIPRGRIEGLIGNDRLSPIRPGSWDERDYALLENLNPSSTVPDRLNAQIQDIHIERDILIRGYVVFATGSLGSEADKPE